jgi:hypothetical protein
LGQEAAAIGQRDPEMQPQRILRVEVHGQHAAPLPPQGIGEIGRERGLADPTLGRCDADQGHRAAAA